MHPARALRPIALCALTALGALGLLAPAPAGARSVIRWPGQKNVSIERIFETAPAIFIATVEGATPDGILSSVHDLRVERTLRGTAVPGQTLKLRQDGSDFFDRGTRLVAFATATGWLAAATLHTGRSLEDGVLHVGTLPGRDTYVFPAITTLAGIKARIQGRPQPLTFRGTLRLATPAGLVPASIQVTATDAGTTGALVTGLPPMAGFPAPRSLYKLATDDPELRVSWSALSPRPFQLTGDITGLLPSGDIEVTYQLTQPLLFDEATLRRYLADPALRQIAYDIELRTGRERIPITIGPASEPPRETPAAELQGAGSGWSLWKSGTAFHSRTVPYHDAELDLDTKFDVRGRATLSWDPAKNEALEELDTLVKLLVKGPLPCIYTQDPARPPCTLHYLGTRLLP